MGLYMSRYSGAYLKLSNAVFYKDSIRIEKRCSEHGRQFGDFCSKCGLKTTDKAFKAGRIKTSKNIYGYSDEFEDLFADITEFISNDEKIKILIPNSEGEWNLNKCDSEGKTFILNYEDLSKEETTKSVLSLKYKFNEYISFLESEDIIVEIKTGLLQWLD